MYQLRSGKVTVSSWKWWFIADLAIKNCDFPVRYVGLPEGKTPFPQFCAAGVTSVIKGEHLFHVHPKKYMVVVLVHQ